MKRFFLLLGVLFLGLPPLSAQASFWLRNTDPDAVFLYWTIEGTTVHPQADVLATLPLAPGGRHGVAPGERVRVLSSGRNVVGTFVPWTENLSFQTPLTGGYLMASEIPAKGTLLVDRPSFAAANRGRTIEAPLQQWGLRVPQFVLDGRIGDWAKIRPAVEWGPGFLPGNKPWPANRPRPRILQAVDREGALWLHFAADQPWASFPPGVSASLVLRRPGAFLEWPLTGGDSTVWSWAEGTDPVAVGWRLSRGSDLEAWVPWDRMSAADRLAWSAPATWALVITENNAAVTLDLAPTSLGEWP